MTEPQTFAFPKDETWLALDGLPGVELMALATPVTEGSIHRARLSKGTVIPAHTHPNDEFVQVLSGTVETGGVRCDAGTFWRTPGGVRQGPHVALEDVELLTIRLGPMGVFDVTN